mmetsp:Transcript_61647/g.198588  ORF Transcript_61647/g.198588 Transcript_61647/m.198588 type:complete len:515 (+) Transcript_61647:109-1653(+)
MESLPGWRQTSGPAHDFLSNSPSSPSRFLGPGSDAGHGDGGVSTLQGLACGLLAVVGLAALHGLLYHLHAILVPFVLSGFIVLALQPSVELIYGLLAGLRPPYRWCCCGFRRRRRRSKRHLSRLSTQSTGPTTNPDVAAGWCWGPDAGCCPCPCCWGRNEADEEAQAEAEPLVEEGQTEELCTNLADGFSRFIAVSVVIWGMVIAALLGILLLCRGAVHMKDNWDSYRTGLQRLERMQDSVVDAISRDFDMTQEMDHRLKAAYYELYGKAEDWMWEVVNAIISSLSEGLSFMAMLLLYVLFWLMAPLPTTGKAGLLVRSYIYKKTVVSFFYGLCVTLLFVALDIDLAVLFGIISFFLNYVPEVGAFISMAVPIPIILLDGRHKHPFLVLAEALVGQLLLKFIFSNVLEVKLIERDKEMSIHPVWVILGLSYFGFVWGPIGMLISVPMLAMLKTAALSAHSGSGGRPGDPALLGGIPVLAEIFLACFEGRKWRRRSKPSSATSSPAHAPRLPQNF